MDYTLCDGWDCPLKEKCFRFKAKSKSLYQSYFTEMPYDKIKKECSEFWADKVKTEKL